MIGPAIKYLSVLTIPATALVAFHSGGWLSYLPVLYAFGLVPLFELLLAPDPRNLTEAEALRKSLDPGYDIPLYLAIAIQYFCLFFFLGSITEVGLDASTLIGRTLSMGILCGILGINVAHELGHRPGKGDQFLSKLLLLSSMYMHFNIEHNRGHHKHVSTDDDPASARFGESVYGFWARSIVYSYLSAWRLEAERLRKKKLPVTSLHNEMIVFQIAQLLLTIAITIFYGFTGLIYFLAAAMIGILLLETVNYIEHYGLRRKRRAEGGFERVMPHHSWNSDHLLGRLMLFELSRHSDHHYIASRKYQTLRHYDKSPQMPTGYPGMMLLSLVPPLWFWIMHRQIDRFQAIANTDGGAAIN